MNGCDSVLTINLTITSPNAPTGSASQSFCNNATIADLVASGTSIQWYATSSGGTALAPTTALSNGTTYYASQTIAACESSTRLAVTISINFVTDITTSLSGITISANNASASYLWLDCNNNFTIIPGETAQSFTATSNGNYAVQLTQNGCVDTSACVSITSVGLVQNQFENHLKVYPNPSSGNFTIDLGQSLEQIFIEVCDIQGRIILSQEFTQTKLIDLTLNKPTGVYLLTISSQLGKSKIKLFKI